MSRAFNALNAAGAAALLAACGSGGNAPAPLPEPQAAPAPPLAIFACEGGARVAVLEAEARVIDGDAALRLARVPSASGSAFEDEDANSFRAKGGEGMLSREGGAPVACRAGDEADGAPPLPFTARAGDWTARVSDTAVALETRTGIYAGPAGRPERRGAITTWSTSTRGGALSVRLRPGPCRASVGGLPAPYYADIALADDERRGCAGDPAVLLVGTWRLDGATPQLTFAEDGTLSGDTGCNRLSGAYGITGGALRIGPLSTTRMACPSGAAREARMLRSLEAADGFELTLQGELILTGGEGELYLVRSTR